MLSWRATIFFKNINNNFIYFANMNLPKFRESVTPSERLQQERRASVLQPKKIVKNVFGPKPGLWSECLHTERRRALQAQASDPADRGLHRGKWHVKTIWTEAGAAASRQFVARER